MAEFLVQGCQEELNILPLIHITDQEELILPVKMPHHLNSVIFNISLRIQFQSALGKVGEGKVVRFGRVQIFLEDSVHIFMFAEVKVDVK